MKKYIADWTIKENIPFNDNECYLLKLSLEEKIPIILPGQFVQVLVEDSSTTFLRRPISVHFVDKEKNELWLLVQVIGNGTRKLSERKKGDRVNLIYPLGNGFSLPEDKSKITGKLLLIGGGVGVAPLLYLGACLQELGYSPEFLLGAKIKKDVLQINEFGKFGKIYITTEDGSAGEKGFVTNHSILQSGGFDFIYTCGPKPMMAAVVRYAREKGIACEVSLENTMACGIGACLCCVEKTVRGNVCVCTEGPVMNINQLTWQI
ncbi:MAG: dihydroorotate dehydrogenase electron transfer subunit [Dysgonamonadaceae bacterium]|jgi:dihydroorotate dehydrogenase electron transfer subunit|nr:dihydroorotate dehydrogenase electron transfer subunit [Dysgonamonadaceae bacterium]